MVSGRTLDVWLAVRDGGALTPRQIHARLPAGFDGDTRAIGPNIGWLVKLGWLKPVGKYRYVNARLERSMR